MTDRLNAYRKAMSTLAETVCAPYWWSVKTEASWAIGASSIASVVAA